jgi:hypothetical protein
MIIKPSGFAGSFQSEQLQNSPARRGGTFVKGIWFAQQNCPSPDWLIGAWVLSEKETYIARAWLDRANGGVGFVCEGLRGWEEFPLTGDEESAGRMEFTFGAVAMRFQPRGSRAG